MYMNDPLDDVNIDNGGMRMVNFTGLPKVRKHNLPVVQDQEDSGPNFFQHIPDEYIPEEAIIQANLIIISYHAAHKYF